MGLKHWLVKLKSRFAQAPQARGLAMFPEIPMIFKAEEVLKQNGLAARVVAPPPHLREGCDLAVEFDILEKPAVERTLREQNLELLHILSLDDPALEPLDIVKSVDFGDLLMVRAANMKMTIDKKTGRIENISGGGCPDVPYLYVRLVGKKLDEVPRPTEIGFTLCALMLDRAHRELCRIHAGSA